MTEHVNTPNDASAVNSASDGREVSLPVLVFMAVIVGIVAALGAIVFKYLIAVIYNLSFYGILSYDLDPNVYGAPSPWGPWIILVPVIGGLIVVFLVETFAPEAKGHGVPEVMYSIYHQGGNIRGIVAVVKSFASALSIGTGASVGREGPIIQIGSSFGSTFARKLGLVRSQKIILLSAGAGAGIAATFNTPLGGVLFAVEVLLPEISSRSFLPVVAATATSTYFARMILGAGAAFHLPAWIQMPRDSVVNFTEISFAALTGIAIGLAAYLFVIVLEYMEDTFEEAPLGPYISNIIGMLMVGAMGYGFYLISGHYHVLSVGYSTIQDVLSDNSQLAVLLLLALFVGKLFATTISLGSGASGGIFSPSLFMGATLGAAIGTVGTVIFPEANLSIAVFAMIGMGAMVGASTSAAMTAIVMIFEMTRDYNLILPLVLAVAIALGIRQALVANDIYTIKLRKRGRTIPTDRSTNMFLVQPVKAIMSTEFRILSSNMSVVEALQDGEIEADRVVVSDENHIVGYVRFANVSYKPDRYDQQTLGDIMETDFVIAGSSNTLNYVITRMSRRERSFAIVLGQETQGVPRSEDIVGIIDHEELAKSVVVNHYD